MKINSKLLGKAVSEICAREGVCVLQESESKNEVELAWIPKQAAHVDVDADADIDVFTDVSFIKIPVVSQEDIFSEEVDTLDAPVPIFIPNLQAILNSESECLICGGKINGKDASLNIKKQGTINQVVSDIAACVNNYRAFQKAKQDYITLTFSKKEYEYIAKTCVKFVSVNPNRFFMTGVCFGTIHSDSNTMDIVATDARRLVKCAINFPHDENQKDEFIVPTHGFISPRGNYASAVIKLYKNNDSKYGEIAIKTDKYSIYSHFACIDGVFPNYPKVIPDNADLKESITINNADFLKAFSETSEIGKDKDVIIDSTNKEKAVVSFAISNRFSRDPNDLHFNEKASLSVKASRAMVMKMSGKFLCQSLSVSSLTSKFLIQDVNHAVVLYDKEGSFRITKVFMPMAHNDEEGGFDNWGLPKPKEEEKESTGEAADANQSTGSE